MEGVNRVTFVSREEAFDMMRSRMGDRGHLMDAFEPSIFPPAYMVTLTDLDLNVSVQNQINELDNVYDITSRNDTINALAAIARWVRAITLFMLLILIGISVFIISNTIKLTVHVRRKEISIMKYVGATNNFIRTPFIIEGIIIGLVSGLFSILIVSGGYTIVARRVAESEMAMTIGVNMLDFSGLVN
ncbi:MAG: permease-like cell division protein FtsX, partial [Oscillospiraceae bacterium]|nr:permease-like cell division protein FtsX [Oscillospiraceae bacterium]